MNFANILVLFKNLPQGNWGKTTESQYNNITISSSFSSYEFIVYGFSGTKWLKRMLYIESKKKHGFPQFSFWIPVTLA